MGELGVPHKLIRSRVKIDGEYSQAFHINRGLKQGDALSPVLFNFALENAIRTVKTEFLAQEVPNLFWPTQMT